MSECKYKLDDLKNGLGCDAVMSGVKTVLIGLIDDVAVWPQEIETPTSMEENVMLSGVPVMKPGKRMFRLYSKNDAGEYQYTGQGEEGSRSQQANLNIYNPGFRKSINGFIRAVQNAQLFIICLTNQGEWHVMGDKYRGAVLSEFTATSGKAVGDPNGVDMTFIYNTPSDRVIELTDAQVEALCSVSSYNEVTGTLECEADTTQPLDPMINVVGNITANDYALGMTFLKMQAGSNSWTEEVMPDESGDFTATVPGKEGEIVTSPVNVTLYTHILVNGEMVMKQLAVKNVYVS